MCVLVLSFVPASLSGQVVEKEELAEVLKGPLLEEEPFDLIFLDPYNRESIMKVVPLKKAITPPYPTDGFLVFEFREDSENLLQVPWTRVVISASSAASSARLWVTRFCGNSRSVDPGHIPMGTFD